MKKQRTQNPEITSEREKEKRRPDVGKRDMSSSMSPQKRDDNAVVCVCIYVASKGTGGVGWVKRLNRLTYVY